MPPKYKRPEAIVKYVHTPANSRTDVAGPISNTLPMAAMFLRNKAVLWVALFLAVQAWLNEPAHRPANDTLSPPLLKVAFGFLLLALCYAELVIPGMLPAAQAALKAATAA